MNIAIKEALRVVVSIALSVFIAEMLVMLILSQLEDLSTLTESIVDASLLTVLLAPALYFLVYRPLKREIKERRRAETDLRTSLHNEKVLNEKLTAARDQLLESEKLVSMGQIAAGVAHEINNPVGFVASNMGSLETYLDDLLKLVSSYENCHPLIQQDTELFQTILAARESADIDYLKSDSSDLIKESQDGIARIKRIVQDLKDFSRSDDGVYEFADLNHELDRTLNIVNNELKYHTKLEKVLGEIPAVECVPSQINQVLLNLLVNAGQAIEKEGIIRICTELKDDQVQISITDNGCGMSEQQLTRIFEPFYTTKPRGKGTGLGLSVSWGIIQTHGGSITAESEQGKGTTFRVCLPLKQANDSQEKQVEASVQAG
ncbi:MAG: ATP-binding protein [Motiliproteus sp.]